MSEGLVELDGDLTVVWLNRSAERMIERERHTVLGKRVFEAIPALRDSVLSQKLEVARASGAPVSFSADLALARDLKHYAIRLFPQRDPDTISVFIARRSTPDDQEQDAF